MAEALPDNIVCNWEDCVVQVVKLVVGEDQGLQVPQRKECVQKYTLNTTVFPQGGLI